jgi:tRNA pseudouridine38-40 synthase
MRIAAVLEYDGSAFSGWQLQSRGPTVQRCVEAALSKVADEPIRVTVAGRTDAGVHAAAQVIHFDTQAERSGYSWVHGANRHLPSGVALLWAQSIGEEFHARFSATGRHYDYVVLNRPVRPAIVANRVTHEYRTIDVARMKDAASLLIGRHDFTSFRAANCQAKNPVRELRALEISRAGEIVRIHVYANAFLQHMVRNIAGVLLEIGAGERESRWAGEVLEARDRTLGGVTAGPDGLYLTAIEYPNHFEIPRLSSRLCLW